MRKVAILGAAKLACLAGGAAMLASCGSGNFLNRERPDEFAVPLELLANRPHRERAPVVTRYRALGVLSGERHQAKASQLVRVEDFLWRP